MDELMLEGNAVAGLSRRCSPPRCYPGQKMPISRLLQARHGPSSGGLPAQSVELADNPPIEARVRAPELRRDGRSLLGAGGVAGRMREVALVKGKPAMVGPR
jgi:hypothetical protein